MYYSNRLSQWFLTLVERNIWLSTTRTDDTRNAEISAYNSSVAPILQQGRERIVILMARASSALGIMLFCLYQFSSLPKIPSITILYGLMLSALLILAFRADIPFNVRFWSLGAVMYVVALVDMLAYGVWVFGPLLMFVLVIYVLTLISTRVGLVTIIVCAFTILTFGIIMSRGLYMPPLSPFDKGDLSVENSIVWAFDFSFAATFALVIIHALTGFIRRAWEREREAVLALNQKAQQLNISLEREKQLALALQQSLDNERKLNQLRTQIIHTVSHEFRTPLTTISSSNALLQNYHDRMPVKKQVLLFSRIQDAVSRLTLFMDDVTTVMNADEIAQSYEIIALPFADLAEQVKASLHETHDELADISFRYNTADKTEFSTDPVLVGQVCQILVDNAVKFQATEIKVSLLYQAHQVELVVKDNGIGIPPSEEGIIFGLLQRGSNTEFISGLGIGLYLAKNIVELLGGTIHAASGSETIFTATLPSANSGMIPSHSALEK